MSGGNHTPLNLSVRLRPCSLFMLTVHSIRMDDLRLEVNYFGIETL